jgi:sRNA-binding carbon storage regulator CsrA
MDEWQSVVIGDHNRFECRLKVTVMEIWLGRVTLGLEVDEDVPVHCEEAWERILTDAIGGRHH